MKLIPILTTITTSLVIAFSSFGQAGTLDSSFGVNGKLTISFTGNDVCRSLAIQPDGKIIAAGYGNGYYELARFKINGTLDSSFGIYGKVTTDIVAGSYDRGTAVAIQKDGKILLTGYTYSDFATVRYYTDGSIDPTFGNNGVVVTDISGYSNCDYDQADAITIQPTGKIIVAGNSAFGCNHDFILIRYNINGSTDSSFGNNGVVRT